MIYTNVKMADQTCDCILHMKQKNRHIKQHLYMSQETKNWNQDFGKIT